MKKILLCLLLLTTFNFYAQVSDIVHCSGDTTFDLTQQKSLLIGNQNPSETTVSYHLTLADASNGTNAIANPTTYISTVSSKIIYARIDHLGDISTNYFGLIVNPTLVSVAVATIPTSCINNGTITAIASGGQAPYLYSIDGIQFQYNNTFSNIVPGIYPILVKDALGCVSTSFIVLEQPIPLAITTAITNVTCYGNNNGSITTIATGGQAPYSYSIDGIKFQTNNTFSNLAPGTYSTFVKDDNGCMVSNTSTITQPVSPLAISMVITDVNCYGANDGSIITHVTGGKEPYSYTLDYGAPIFISGSIFTSHGLASGTHTVEVKDANGCTISSAGTLTQPAAPLAITAVSTNVNCHGANDGSITITTTDGKAPYQYSIDGTQFSVSNFFPNLAAGNYSTFVKDANGCVVSNVATISQPIPLAITAAIINVTCHGSSDGSISINATGGSGSYLFSLSNGVFISGPQSRNVFTNLTPGAYTVTVTDSNGCTASIDAIVTEPAALSLIATTTTNQTVTAIAIGGTTPYQYSLNGGAFQTGNTFSNLAPGTYVVILKDANGCSATNAITIEPTIINAVDQTFSTVSGSTTTVAVLNNDTIDGMSVNLSDINLTIVSAPTGFTLNTNGTITVAAETSSGVYNLTYQICQKSDPANCATANVTIIVTQPAQIPDLKNQCAGSPFDLTSQNSLLIGNLNPNQTIISYHLSLVDATNGLNAIVNPSTYTSSVASKVIYARIDYLGTITTKYFSLIVNPPLISVAIVTAPIGCISNGTITVTTTGGQAPYLYSIDGNTFHTGNTFSILTPGIYSISVKDVLGCSTTTNSIVLEQPFPLTMMTTISNVACYGDNNGSITINATEGQAPYLYSIDNEITYTASNTFSNLAPGTYSSYVKDANGCVVSNVATISQPIPLAITAAIINVTCHGASDGSITINTIGGSSSYLFSLSNGVFISGPQSSNVFTNLTPGTYAVMVTDSNGCTASIDAIVTEPAALSLIATTTTNQTVTAIAIGGTTPYQYSLNGGAFQTSNTFNNLAPGTYVVVLKDANGCSATTAITIAPTIIVVANETFITTPGNTTTSVFSNDTLNGQPIILSDIIATATPIPGFTFNPNGTITVASGTQTGTYLLTYTIASISSSAMVTGIATITVTESVEPPTGKTTQSLPQGATLADLVVAGENVEWYASLTGKFKRTTSTPLPLSTPLVDNMTYYASQTINGIRSPERLAVKVTLKTPGPDDPIFGDFTYYPNPVKDVFTILNPSTIDEAVLSSITGQTLLTKKINGLRSEIDLSNLSNGIYLLKIKAQGQEKTVKIIKK